MNTKSQQVGIATACAILSFSAGPVGVVVQKWLAQSFDPSLIVAIQMSAGALVLWAVRWIFFPVGRLSWAALLQGLGLGLLHPGLFMIVYTTASARLDSVTAVLLLALVPALVAIGGRLALNESLRPVMLVGIAISGSGLMVLVSERSATGANEPSGLILGFLGLLLAGGAVVAGRALNTGAVLPWYVLAPLQTTGAAMVSWLGVLVAGAEVDIKAIASHLGAFTYLALGMTAASYLAYNFALSRLPTPQLGLLAAAGPGVGALAAAAVFATPVGPVALIGIAIIITGAALPAVLSLARRK